MSDVEVVIAPTGAITSAGRPASDPAVHRLIEAVHRATGHRPLSDQMWLDLTGSGRAGSATVLAWSGRLDADGATRQLDGLCQVARGNGTWEIEVVLDTALDRAGERRATAERLVRSALAHIGRAGGGHVHWWVFADRDDELADVARTHALTSGRALHQMRVPLPLDSHAPADLALRPFRVGADERDWLEVNNAAFADHPEQGGWDAATLERRERERWFDPEGFLLHHRGDRLAAFCWTKLHPTSTGSAPELGEIYVIAVHPDFHGLGLGRALTLAGLDSIARRGVPTGMLYVDDDNTAAFGLYRALGFQIHRTDRAYVGDVEPTDLRGPGPAP